MPIINLFSRRKKRSDVSEPDVYQYDTIPEGLRVQIRHIWADAIGPYYIPHGVEMHPPPHNNEAWHFIHNTMCREKGLSSLANRRNAEDDCIVYLLEERNTDDLLDIIELSFHYVDRKLRHLNDYKQKRLGIRQDPDDAIEELNFRFREAGVGYQFDGGQVVRVDSQLIHGEAVIPALQLLSDPRFSGPNEEFRAAHAHYRAGEYKDCAADALNAFESTMKAICDIKGWDYEKGARASDLVKVLRKSGLLPDYLDKSFDQLIATLSSGLPTVRNEEGGHGQGAQPRATPAFVAAYALHLAAAKIVLLVDAMKASE